MTLSAEKKKEVIEKYKLSAYTEKLKGKVHTSNLTRITLSKYKLQNYFKCTLQAKLCPTNSHPAVK